MSYKDKYISDIESLFYDLENRIMADIIRRIKKTGGITSTADWQIDRLQVMGYSSEEIEAFIMKALNATWPEMFELYDAVMEKEYTRDKRVYEQINGQFIPFGENEQLQQWLEAAKVQTQSTLQNLTKTLGVVDNINGQMTFLPLTQYYQRTLDAAILDITSGAFDYNSVLKRTVNSLTRSGIRVIDYASGYSSRVAVAARRAVMTGISQMTGKVAEENAAKLGTEYFEVAWHANARPSHRSWQGKVWSKEQLVTVCGLGSVTGLCGVNCYHEYYPFFPGISERNWTDEWLREQNAKEDIKREFKGKEYTAYEATQKQRQMETAMRAQRQKVKMLQQGGADPDDVVIAKAKYQAQLQEYKSFCKGMDLTPQMERVYIDGLGRTALSKDTFSRYTPEMIRNATRDSAQYERYRKILGTDAGTLAEFRQIKYNNSEKWGYLQRLKKYIEEYPNSNKQFFDIQEELKSLEIVKGVVLPAEKKQAFILPSGKSDPYHIMHRMLERQISDDDVRRYMDNAKVMFVQWNGNRQMFFSSEGVSVISKVGEDWIYKTVWSEKDFDEVTLKILEVINKHVN